MCVCVCVCVCVLQKIVFRLESPIYKKRFYYNKCSIFFFKYHHHHHLLVPPAQISLTLSRHSSLSFIASCRSSELHPVSSQSCCM